MEKLYISRNLMNLRKEKGITQEHLASHLGVTKASISKWETGQSLPDILLLPKIAAYYNVTVDQLMGYVTELDANEIREIHGKLSKAFSERSFKEAILMCEEVTRDNYSCFPMLLKITELYVNYLNKAESKEDHDRTIEEIKRLTGRIQKYSKDDTVRNQAKGIEALIYLAQGDGKHVLEMYGDDCPVIDTSFQFIAEALVLTGNKNRAQEVCQVSAYQYLMAFLNNMTLMLSLFDDNQKYQEIIAERIEKTAFIFNLLELNPNILAVVYYLIAENYGKMGEVEKTMEYVKKYFMLERYFDDFNIRGDSFFNKIDRWLRENTVVPRSKQAIKQGYAKSIFDNPVFDILNQNEEYKKIKEEHINA